MTSNPDLIWSFSKSEPSWWTEVEPQSEVSVCQVT